MGITHTTAATGTDSGDGKISKNAWNEAHDLSTLSLEPSIDTQIAVTDPTTNYASDGTLYLSDSLASASYSRFILQTYDLSSITGNVLRADLMMYKIGDNGNAGIFTGHLGLRRILRTDVDLSQATWNVYKTASNWSVSGARGTADAEPTFWATVLHMSPYNTVAQWISFDVAALIRRCLLDSVTSLTVLIAPATAATGSQNGVPFASKEYATAAYRPSIKLLTA